MSALPLSRTAAHPALPHRERGVVLLVALVMLLLVTVLGLASVRMLTLEERMAANSFDRNLAFQAAETALREGEALAELQLLAANGPNAGFSSVAMVCNSLNNGACAGGLCSPPRGDCTAARWEDSAFAGWRNATAAASPLATGRPQFFVEHLGSAFPCDPQKPTENPTCERYRITARSHDPATAAAQGRANVVLQSIYAGMVDRAAANPPTQFIPESFALTEAAQHAGEVLLHLDSSQNGLVDTEIHKIDDSDYAGEESAEGDGAINVNVVRGRISWREIIPR
ncbi:MAG: PilX N-terminal domain-containing pilus assembly protein [Serpentinimonas sp.]|nr:PilX N-terminal domain-containing pilus assembly protein [Serpentinimonas sp.]